MGHSPIASAQAYDPIVFSFATVGDNRQDPKKPDQTTFLANGSPTTTNGGPSLTGGLLPQDQIFLENSLAWNIIQQGITGQGAQLLFFNGDMIYGYGRPTLPSQWTSAAGGADISGVGYPANWKTPITSANLPANPLTPTTSALYPDGVFEYIQYAYWRGQIAQLFTTGTYVIPVPGNHETQCSNQAYPYSSSSPNPQCAGGSTSTKTAYPENENAFRANTEDLVQDLSANLRFSTVSGVFATNLTGVSAASAPGVGGTPCAVGATTATTCYYTAGGTLGGQAVSNTQPGATLSGSQQFLDYSFDVPVPNTSLLLHFAVINTDPAGSDATAPSDWLAGDLAAAQARAQSAGKTAKYFVFGHKPAFYYIYNSTVSAGGGLDQNLATANAFWHVITTYGATYFSGHEHIPNVQAYPDPLNPSNPNVSYQVIVGSGGSPFDDALNANLTEPAENHYEDRYYAWAWVQVHQSGAVTLNMSGFPDTGIGGGVYDLQNYDVPGTTFSGNLQ